MKRRHKLGDVELEILHIVWKRGEATVSDVLAVIRKRRKTAYTTVMTMMRNLAQKGVLKYRTEGRTFVYSAAVAPEIIRRTLLEDTVDRVFGGSPVELVQNLIDAGKLSEKDVGEIKKMIEEME